MVLPSVVIGDTVLRGRLDVPGLAAAACRAAPEEERAQNALCQCTAKGSGDPLACAQAAASGKGGGLGGPAVPPWVIGVIAGLVAVVGLLVVGGLVLHRGQQGTRDRLEQLLHEEEQDHAAGGRMR